MLSDFRPLVRAVRKRNGTERDDWAAPCYKTLGAEGGMTKSVFSKVEYRQLNGKQQEVHNFHQIAARLAQYGYATYPIRDDWNGGDMIARHMTEAKKPTLTIQVKGRLTFSKKYIGKELWEAFPLGARIFVFPHDAVLKRYLALRNSQRKPLDDNDAWKTGGTVHWGRPTADLLNLLTPYELEF